MVHFSIFFHTIDEHSKGIQQIYKERFNENKKELEENKKKQQLGEKLGISFNNS